MASNRLRAATASDPHLILPALAAWMSIFRYHRAGLEPCSGPGPVQCWLPASAPSPRRCVSWGWARRRSSVATTMRWTESAGTHVPWRDSSYVLDRLLPNGPVVIGIDDTVERRRIYRDPVRSSKGHFVETSGLRWLFSLMVVVPISWSGRHLALPFLTVLAPSARADPPEATQDADRLGTPGDPANQRLAACSL